MITVGIYLEDCYEKNGPLKVIKGSHKKELFSHHSKDNYFVGKINTKKNKINLKKSVSLTGKAGSVAFFHCRTIHGSGLNHTNGSRPLILFGYRACDAWPIINDGNPHPETNFENYDANIIYGKKSIVPRCTDVPVIIPLPKKKHYVSIYQVTKKVNKLFFIILFLFLLFGIANSTERTKKEIKIRVFMEDFQKFGKFKKNKKNTKRNVFRIL